MNIRQEQFYPRFNIEVICRVHCYHSSVVQVTPAEHPASGSRVPTPKTVGA